MEQIICDKEIAFSSISVFDTVGTVFFASGRVFRVINETYRQDVLKFLSSDLFHELRNRGLLVDTWIASDISLRGYSTQPLILEHEKMFVYHVDLWSFEQKKAATVFLLELFEISKKHGYILKDITYSNVTLKNGKFVFLDIGSFFGDNHSKSGFICAAVQRYVYLHMDMMQYKKYPCFSLRNIKAEAYHYMTVPALGAIETESTRGIVHRFVHKYDCYIKLQQKRYHFCVRGRLTIALIDALNKVARIIFKRHIDCKMIKIRPVFKVPAKKTFENLKLPFKSWETNYFPIQKTSRLLSLREWLISQSDIKSILILGNYNIDHLQSLHDLLSFERMNVISPDCIWANAVYGKSVNTDLNIFLYHPLAIEDNNEKIVNAIQSDILYVGDMFDILLQYPTRHTKIALFRALASLSRYVVFNTQFTLIQKEESMSLFFEEVKLTKVTDCFVYKSRKLSKYTDNM